MKANFIIGISPPIPYPTKFWFSSYRPKCCWPVKLQDSLKCYISRKKWMIKFIFGTQINMDVFLKLASSFLSYKWILESRLTEDPIMSICLSVRLSTCLSVPQFGIFVRNGSLVFPNFSKNVDNKNIQKLTEPFHFQENFIFP